MECIYIYIYIYMNIALCIIVLLHVYIYMHTCIYIYILMLIYTFIYISKLERATSPSGGVEGPATGQSYVHMHIGYANRRSNDIFRSLHRLLIF